MRPAVMRRNRSSSVSVIPSDLANLSAWYDASAITGASDNATFATWSDRSSNGHTMTASSGPKLRISSGTRPPNGNPAVEFPALSSANFQTPAFTTSATDTVFAVCRVNTSTGNDAGRIYDTGGNRNLIQINGVTDGHLGLYQSGTNTGTPLATTADVRDSWHVLSVTFGPTARCYCDGVLLTQDTYTGTSAPTGARFLGYDSGSAHLNGLIAEVIIYARSLTTTERQSIENYLKVKYGTP